jgi:hypothetical protein
MFQCIDSVHDPHKLGLEAEVRFDFFLYIDATPKD